MICCVWYAAVCVVCCVWCVAGECNDNSGGEVASWNQGLVLQARYVLYVLYPHNCLCVCVREMKSVCLCRCLCVAMFIGVSFFISILQRVLTYSPLYSFPSTLSLHSYPPLLFSLHSYPPLLSLHSYPPLLFSLHSLHSLHSSPPPLHAQRSMRV